MIISAKFNNKCQLQKRVISEHMTNIFQGVPNLNFYTYTKFGVVNLTKLVGDLETELSLN